MQYYLLQTDVDQINQISISEYFTHVSQGTDGILVMYNPDEGTVASMSDISSYFFHDFNGKLDTVVCTSEQESSEFIADFTDGGRDTRAMRFYRYAINNNEKYYPIKFEDRDYSNRSY